MTSGIYSEQLLGKLYESDGNVSELKTEISIHINREKEKSILISYSLQQLLLHLKQF